MMTPLQHLTARLTRALSLHVVEGAATQKLFALLDTQIDTGVAALEGATNRKEMAAAEAKFGHVFKTFGSDGANFGEEFRSVARVFDRAEDALIGAGASPLGALTDLQAFDAQMRVTGHDFNHFGADMNLLGSLRGPAALPGAVAKAASVTTALAADFVALGGQAAALAGDLNPPGAAASPASALGAELAPLAAEFNALATDFANFSTLLGGHPGAVPGAASGGATTPLTFDGVFASLDMDFIALDATFKGAASPIAQMLLPPPSVHQG